MPARHSAAAAARDSASASVAGLDLVVPGDWWRVPLSDAAARTGAVKALIRHRLSDRDARSAATHEAESLLQQLAADAARAGGRAMWFSTLSVAGMPLPMSLVIAEERTAHEAFQRAVEAAHQGGGLEAGRMGPGMVVRSVVERTRDLHELGPSRPDPGSTRGGAAPGTAEEGAAPRVVRVLVADYYLRRADQQIVHLSFASPLVQAREQLVGLFDTIVDSVQWQEGAANATDERGTDVRAQA